MKGRYTGYPCVLKHINMGLTPGYYTGFIRKGDRVHITFRDTIPECIQNQTAVSYTLRLLSDF